MKQSEYRRTAVAKYLKENPSATVREIQVALDFSSPSIAHFYMKQVQGRGITLHGKLQAAQAQLAKKEEQLRVAVEALELVKSGDCVSWDVAEKTLSSLNKTVWVCEAHPEKIWPDECNCSAGMPRQSSHKIALDALKQIAKGAPESAPEVKDEFGCLYSYGNYDDCYSDGMSVQHFNDAQIARNALQQIAAMGGVAHG